MKNSTALGAKEKTTHTITFKSKQHENFYQEYLSKVILIGVIPILSIHQKDSPQSGLGGWMRWMSYTHTQPL